MALSVEIEKRLGSFHLNVAFEAEDGILALLGASGCGKSMTLKCIAGIERPDRGRIVLNGRVLFDSAAKINLKPQERRVGYLFQQYALFPGMSVRQNIACGIRKDSAAKTKEQKERVIRDMIRLVNLEGMEDHLPNQLSGGQQQRVALARILVNEPDVLLLDEPFSALDTYLRLQMEREVKNILADFHHPVIFVSHDRDEVFRLSSRIVVMENGSLQRFGTRNEVFKYPGTVRAAILTGCTNISPIEKLGGPFVYAPQFGARLKVDGDLTEIDSIGIPAHHVKYGKELDKILAEEEYDKDNLLTCDIADVIENPGYFTLFLRPEGSREGSLRIDVERMVWKGLPHEKMKIYIFPKGIRLLKNIS